MTLSVHPARLVPFAATEKFTWGLLDNPLKALEVPAIIHKHCTLTWLLQVFLPALSHRSWRRFLMAQEDPTGRLAGSGEGGSIAVSWQPASCTANLPRCPCERCWGCSVLTPGHSELLGADGRSSSSKGGDWRAGENERTSYTRQQHGTPWPQISRQKESRFSWYL